MKKQAFYLMAAALCGTLALASCSTETDELEVVPAAKQVSVTLTLPGGADTRTTYTEKKDGSDSFAGLKTAWAEGDKITLVKAGNFTNLVTLTQTGELAEGATTATFTGDISSLGEINESTTLLLFYPEITEGGTKCLDYRVQDGTMVNLGKYDFLVDYSVKYKDGKLVPSTAGFERRSSFIRLPKDTYVGSSGSIDIELYGEKDVIMSTNAPTAEIIYSVADGENNIHVSTIATSDGKLSSDVYIAFGAGEKGATKVYLKIGANTYEVAGDGISFVRSKMYTITDLSKYKNLDDYIDLSADETANTYMVTKAGKYKFKATVKGNGGYDPITKTTATPITGIAGVKVLWELYGQGRAIKHDGSDYDIFYSDDYVYFSSPEESTSGDCYVAVYDNEGTILWSWLIWRTPEVGTKSHNEKTFMDRNLGAIDVGNCMRGFLYEWGRKDAFSAANGGYDVYPYVPVAATVFTHITGPYSMDYTIKNPTQWIRGNDGSYSWMYETEYSLKPWQPDVKTIYDPCPSGWRIPVKEEISNIPEMPDTGIGGGYDPDEYYKGFGNPGTGYYWTTSTDEGSDQRAYAFCNDGRNINHWGQDQGYAIRPVKE